MSCKIHRVSLAPVEKRIATISHNYSCGSRQTAQAPLWTILSLLAYTSCMAAPQLLRSTAMTYSCALFRIFYGETTLNTKSQGPCQIAPMESCMNGISAPKGDGRLTWLHDYRGNDCPPCARHLNQCSGHPSQCYPHHTELGVPFLQLQKHKSCMIG